MIMKNAVTTIQEREILEDISAELHAANKLFPGFNSAHEGYAVLLEEVDELWDEVKKKKLNPAKAYKEAKQVAAMGAKFMQFLDAAYDFKG